MTTDFTPLLLFDRIELTEDNALLVKWEHKMGAIKLCEELLNHGVSEERVRWMLGQLRENQELTREIAAKRPNCLLLDE